MVEYSPRPDRSDGKLTPSDADKVFQHRKRRRRAVGLLDAADRERVGLERRLRNLTCWTGDIELYIAW